jgi:signal transduction histidine kinase
MTVPRGIVDVLIKISPKDSKIIRIEISDCGPKIPDSAKTRMFDWQNRSASPGSGIELPLAGALVRRYGGTIHAEDSSSRPTEEGVRFVIELPVARR